MKFFVAYVLVVLAVLCLSFAAFVISDSPWGFNVENKRNEVVRDSIIHPLATGPLAVFSLGMAAVFVSGVAVVLRPE